MVDVGQVEYNYLGKSGLKISNICLGTAIFGERKDDRPGQCYESLAHTLLDLFTQYGGNFIDTADTYSDGIAEQYVGSWLSKEQKRDQMVIATKVCNPVSNDENMCGLSRKHITRNFEKSLQRLQTNYVDLYQLHCWDPGTPIEETLRTLNDLVRCGKVHYIGVSNFTGWQLQKTIMLSEFMGLNRIVSLQQEYSLLCRATEWECVEVCRNEGIGLIPWGPLKGGWLTGKIRRSKAPPDGSRVSFAESHPGIYYRGMSHPNYSDFANERVWNLLDVMEQIGTMHGKTIAQVGLRWLLQKDFIPSVIVGCKTLKQLEDNIGAGRGWKLTNQQVEELNAASAVEVPLPYGYIENIFSSRKRTSICK